MTQSGQRQCTIATSSPRGRFDKLGFCYLNLVLSHQHSDLMLEDDRRRKFYFSSKPMRAHWALPVVEYFVYVSLEENHSPN
ncbi:MAG: hypothetical protein WBM16_15405, partial [Pseudolabrys sp.]